MYDIGPNSGLIPFREIADQLLSKHLTKERYMQINNLSENISRKLDRELPPNLYFHGLHHTMEDVFPAAVILANSEGISPDDLFVLCGGAITHDTGFIKKYWSNEVEGAKIAGEILPNYGFNPHQVNAAQNIVLATAMPQSPKNLLEELMCDADLFNISRRQYFWFAADSLFKERVMHYEEIHKEFRAPKNIQEWYRGQLKFLKGHHFITSAARNLGDEGKQYNLRELEKLLKALESQ